MSAIGAGGMGEVYRAYDTKLGREVAIKVLPEAFGSDPERVARFRREAQVIAALNHPNIAAIYGVEETDRIHALVLELVEGPTLAELIADPSQLPQRAVARDSGAKAHDRGLPFSTVLSIARQIAEALEAAHERGVVHRDLKPSNIKVREDGTVKVLDFGLAKLVEGSGTKTTAAGGDPPSSKLQTMMSPAVTTATGILLGTAAYSSPEQARGKTVNKRTDIWAFGCVLYEMLAGKAAFAGDAVADVVAQVLEHEPDWTIVPRDVPVAIRTMLKRCLEKDWRKRVGDVAVILYELDQVGAGTSATDRTEGSEAPRATPHASTTPAWRRIALFSAGAAVAGIAITGAAVWAVMRPVPTRVTRLVIPTTGNSALSIQGVDRDVAITPDGSRIVYRGNGQILVRALDQLEPTRLTGLGAPRGLFVSPDGEWVGFFDGVTASLKKVGITGGAAVTLCSIDANQIRGATWSENGTIIFATNSPATGLQQVPASGGDVTVLTRPNRERGEGDHLWPEFLPGGKAVLFTILPGAGAIDNADIAVLDLQAGTQKVLVRGGTHAHYVGSGHLVYGSGGTLRAIGFDLNRLEVVGTPVPVLQGVAMVAFGGVEGAVANNGTLVYLPGDALAGAQRTLVWVDRQGHEELIPAVPRPYQYARLSPDNTRLLMYSSDQEQDLWLWDFARQTETRVTFSPGIDKTPLLMADGQRLVFSSDRDGGVQNLWLQSADGSGSATRLTESSNQQNATSITSDGTRIVLHELVPGRGRDLRLLTVEGHHLESLLETRVGEQGGTLSPDGHWLAYESNSSGRFEIYVRPFPRVGDGQWQVSATGGVQALWSRNGQELFYLAPDGALMGVNVTAGDRMWNAGTPRKILDARYYTGGGVVSRQYDVSTDGKRFLMIKENIQETAVPQNVIVVQNWTEDLKRVVPTH